MPAPTYCASAPRPVSICRAAGGFTLTELLTVIAIIGILAAILISTIGKVRESARASTCISNLRQVATAMRLFTQDNRQTLPVSAEGNENWIFDLTGYYTPRRTSYIGRSPETLATVGSKQKSIFLCESNILSVSSAPTGAASTYGMNHGLSRFNLNSLQQPARLVLMGDMALYNNSWELRMQPNAVNRLPGKIHNGKYHFAFTDGHVAALDDYPTAPDDAFWRP